ncbi:MAG TPA: hypothetical protein VF194_08835 [Ferrovibrio sp.]|uniref:hypothetical protein n=1 Tax=Ferrovibrio sp. TaxID=1917215 RepID=UPI002ECFB14F
MSRDDVARLPFRSMPKPFVMLRAARVPQRQLTLDKIRGDPQRRRPADRRSRQGCLFGADEAEGRRCRRGSGIGRNRISLGLCVKAKHLPVRCGERPRHVASRAAPLRHGLARNDGGTALLSLS